MKLLLTSVDALVDNATGKFFPGIEKQLDSYLALSKENRVAVISIRSSRLTNIPKKFNPTAIPAKYRGTGEELIDCVCEEIGIDYTEDVVILGSKDHDMYTASKLKAIFLRAEYAKKNNPTQVIYTKGYGIPFSTVEALGDFFKHFYDVKDPWYCKIKVSSTTQLYALTKANTKGNVSNDKVVLNNKFKDCLKNDNKKYIDAFTAFFLISTHLIVKEFEEIDYWDIYPTSTGDVNEDLKHFCEKARESFAKRGLGDKIFIRTKKVRKRHEMNGTERISVGCDEQLGSIIVNPAIKEKIKGKCICIIDDFTTYGTSCETARILLEMAGARKIIFIAMGKFGQEYHKYTYKLNGDVYTGIVPKSKTSAQITGTINSGADLDFLTSLKNIL